MMNLANHSKEHTVYSNKYNNGPKNTRMFYLHTLKVCFLLSLIFSVMLVSFDIKPASAQRDLYVYVDELPEYASYASNVMYESTKFWEARIPDLNFYQTDNPANANFRVQWVKEFGVEHVGYAYGSQFIEVGLGDSNCLDRWSPFSANHVAHIMKHEIGHVLGYGHSTDVNDIMYPIAVNREYGIVEQELPFVENHGYFVPLCTSKEVTSFNYSVETDDPTYGFDVYFVPSQDSWKSWTDGKTFEYYSGESCSAKNYLTFSGRCEGVSRNGGLIILTGNTLTKPLTTITVKFEEISDNTKTDTDRPQPKILDNTDDGLNISDSFDVFTDPAQRYTISYPSTWLVDNSLLGQSQVTFSDSQNSKALIRVLYDENIDYTGNSEDEIFDSMINSERESCNELTYSEDGQICYNLTVINSIASVSESGKIVYNLAYTTMRQFSDPSLTGQFPVVSTLSEIHDGNDAWAIQTESHREVYSSYTPLFETVFESFSLVKSQQNDSPVDSAPNPESPILIPEDSESDDVTVSSEVGSVSIEQKTYEIGYSDNVFVKISGMLNNKKQGDRIALTYTYPDGTTDGNILFATDAGYFESLLALDRNSPFGTYEVFVSFSNKVVGTLYFDVVEKTQAHPLSSVITPETPSFDFIEPDVDPYYYVERYNNEPTYKEWFDSNYPGYTIYDSVGVKNPLSFVDTTKNPSYYIDRYNSESAYREWFDENFSGYTIYEAVGIREPTSQIPYWIKTNAKLWSDDIIDDQTFVSGITYLIEKDIIMIGDIPESESSNAGDVPDWVKSTAKLWHQDELDDETFLNGIKYLIERGIIKL